MLSDVEANETSWRTAVDALGLIYQSRRVEDVRLLHKTYLGESNRSAAKRLWVAVKMAIDGCGLIRAECDDVLTEEP